MHSVELLGTRFVSGEGLTPPVPANENLQLLPDWMTPAELIRCELAADFRLRSCPKHRLDWDILIAIERCTLWHCYGVRQG
jgi:hypothetical protein